MKEQSHLYFKIMARLEQEKAKLAARREAVHHALYDPMTEYREGKIVAYETILRVMRRAK